MKTYIFRRSINEIKNVPGTYWVRGIDPNGNIVTTFVSHCKDLQYEIKVADKTVWTDNITDCYIEVQLDSDVDFQFAA